LPEWKTAAYTVLPSGDRERARRVAEERDDRERRAAERRAERGRVEHPHVGAAETGGVSTVSIVGVQAACSGRDGRW
jgi:uridine phosphorylase